MKILHVITGLNDGGAEAVLYRLCQFDKENKHIVISLMDEGKYGALLENEGVDIHCLNMSRGRLGVLSMFRIWKLVKCYQPDVVQTWMFHGDLLGGIFARFAGVKNIVWGVHHTTLVKGESKSSTILIAKINAFLSKFVPKKIIYCAERSREVQESIGFKADKGVVVSNGYDVSQFVPDNTARISFRNELGLQNEFVIGNVGRYDPLKDHQNLLLAAKELKQLTDIPFKFVIVGTGLDKSNAELHSLITEFGLQQNVLFLGRRNDIPSVMNGLDLFVLSSAGEAFPNVLNEAMACGTPCVTTYVGDAARIVGETGWVVPPKDPKALAKNILKAVLESQNNSQVWLKRKQECRSRIVENFSIEEMVKGYHRVWISK